MTKEIKFYILKMIPITVGISFLGVLVSAMCSRLGIEIGRHISGTLAILAGCGIAIRLYPKAK